ncbi:G patch domain-containing protein 1 homolog [Drosophila miranda]|uniref:G patch domain-containing protein 1 homolog n=1 Tax=Drosophila miranda TaxID=7229 RepID=UPI0007E7BDD4|nr:G patch domain-containing protein 1 homolog [Drosophila miranda]
MDDEESLHRFGTPLPPLEKDVVPAKKPLAIEDQIVKDENGKRRFHGAFTGGFSAGFWNTVGSLEGWTPKTFKSSRAEKATPRAQQRPEDFMDKEDLGEFGIAPQGIRTREEFAKESEEEQRTGQRKRKLMQPEQVGPIPGVPVLEHLLRPVRDKVAMRILKSMGWKPGQGVGPRQTRKEKRLASARNKREQYLLEHYGAEGLPSLDQLQNADVEEGNDDDDDDEDDEEITFAPNDYEPIFYTPKENRFGMSYSGLSRDPILSKSSSSHPAAPMQHINLFGQLETQPKQKQLSIRGQAFGVGAFEEEDDDIYARDDLTRYDFSLADKKPKQKKLQHVQQRHVIDGFSEDKSGAALQKSYAIDLPRDFKPRNWLQRRSRFEPMDSERTKKLEARNEYKKTGLGRHDLNPDQRAQLLGEQKSQKEEQQQQPQPPSRNPFKDRGKLLELINAKSEGFTKGGLITEEELPKAETAATAMAKQVKENNATIQEKAVLKTKDLASATPLGGFKPFLADEAKQERYDKFLDAQLKTDAEITEFLANMQPVTLSLWDREMEKKEFIQAAKIYRPLNGLMYDRFVSEATVQAEQAKEQQKPPEERKVVMERTKTMWKPASLLCKRYNIAEPFGGSMLEPPKELKGKPKISIFDYLETSINSKADFQTPTIRPKHMEKPKPAVASSFALAPLAPPAAVAPEPEKEKPAQKKEEEPIVKASFVPRTPLEHAVDESREKPISEKKDLFRSIFEDSDDEEKVAVPPPQIATLSTPQEKLAAINEALGLPSTSAASAATLNVLRNNSPPRGIFAALFKPIEEAAAPAKFAPIEGNKLKIAYKSREERLRNDKELAMAQVPAEDIYGPKLPGKGPPPRTQETDHAEVDLEAKLQHLWQKHAPKKRSADKWVEKKTLSSDDSDSDSSSDTSSSCSASSPRKAKRSRVSKSKKSSHRSSSSKKSKKSKQKSKKKSKKSSDRSKPKAKKKKSKH